MVSEGLQRLFLLLVLILHIVTYNKSNAYSPWEAATSFFKQLFQGPEDLTRNTPSHEIKSEYDFIVIGAGSSGSVVTNRLTEIPEWDVLLLEAGQDETAYTDIPFMSTSLSTTSLNWGYVTEPQHKSCLGLKHKRSRWVRGKVMGGSSVLNAMIYARGHPRDYNDWEERGNYGWSYKDVLPYFLKSENAHGDFDDSHFHAKGGYLDVQRPPHHTPLAQAFLDAGNEYGYPIVDYNSDKILGFSLFQATMRNGTRCSVNKAFLRPIRKRKNLHVAKFAHVTKILIDPKSRVAHGVQFFRNGKYWEVHARKEIILSAGALNTPKLLMLSGIGHEKLLETLKIPLVHHSPGVGHNLQDHVSYGGFSFLVNESVAITAKETGSLSALTEYIKERKGVLTNLGVGEGVAFVKSPISKLPHDYPDLEFMFTATHLGADTSGTVRRHIGIKDKVYETVYGPISGKYGWSIYPILMQPESRGYVTIKSKNPFKPPVMNGNYFTDPEDRDLSTIVEGIKMIIELSETKAFQQYGSHLHKIPFPKCEHIHFGTDEYWRCATRVLTITVHHQCCTAKMGPKSDTWAVVDPELRVYGIQGLRIADASIMPIIPAAHTNAACIMIGERAADMIKDSWHEHYSEINEHMK